MRLISWNVNGLRSVQRNAGLDAVLRLRPDILLLQETKLGRNSPHARLGAYHASFSSATASSHWGVATITQVPPVYVATSVIPSRRFVVEFIPVNLRADKLYLNGNLCL